MPEIAHGKPADANTGIPASGTCQYCGYQADLPGDVCPCDVSPHPHCGECHDWLEEGQAEAEQDRWDREQDQLATEALAELMYPPHPRE